MNFSVIFMGFLELVVQYNCLFYLKIFFNFRAALLLVVQHHF